MYISEIFQLGFPAKRALARKIMKSQLNRRNPSGMANINYNTNLGGKNPNRSSSMAKKLKESKMTQNLSNAQYLSNVEAIGISDSPALQNTQNMKPISLAASIAQNYNDSQFISINNYDLIESIVSVHSKEFGGNGQHIKQSLINTLYFYYICKNISLSTKNIDIYLCRFADMLSKLI